jgi:Fe-S-cluster-containing dehydrogenase component/formate-dependent nitrite reductase membrane component NrfD
MGDVTMTRYAFLIDQDTCIGCHACTVACKAEHEVPLGVNRTWVKYIERGEFPDTRRFYSVNRCNHCDDAPCVAICPTTALFRRNDGIVDFDDSACIGCKSCMNACPYDALYVNPETQTVHKCNFCTQRVEIGLEPSCVVVCPTQSIFAGDIEDPTSKISMMLSRHETTVKAPEQGTKPHVFYKGVDQAAIDPLRTKIAEDGMIWAETTEHHPTIRVDTPGRGKQIVARTAYTTAHPMVWRGKVSAYLVTKAISAGAIFAGAIGVLTGHVRNRGFVGLALPIIALLFAAATGALLVADLKQPKRFYYIFTRPQWGSWLVRGAFILLGHGLFASIWLLGGLVDSPELIKAVVIPAALFAAGTAGYTAFLFGQCEGRDFWQTPLLLPVLLAQAAAGGAGLGLIIARPFDLPKTLTTALTWTLLGSVMALGFLIWTELSSKGTMHVELAQRAMTHGEYRLRFWGSVWIGLIASGGLAIVSLSATSWPIAAASGAAAIVGIALYEDAFVRAGQSVPLS